MGFYLVIAAIVLCFTSPMLCGIMYVIAFFSGLHKPYGKRNLNKRLLVNIGLFLPNAVSLLLIIIESVYEIGNHSNSNSLAIILLPVPFMLVGLFNLSGLHRDKQLIKTGESYYVPATVIYNDDGADYLSCDLSRIRNIGNKKFAVSSVLPQRELNILKQHKNLWVKIYYDKMQPRRNYVDVDDIVWYEDKQ